MLDMTALMLSTRALVLVTTVSVTPSSILTSLSSWFCMGEDGERGGKRREEGRVREGGGRKRREGRTRKERKKGEETNGTTFK